MREMRLTFCNYYMPLLGCKSKVIRKLNEVDNDVASDSGNGLREVGRADGLENVDERRASGELGAKIR